MMLSLASITCGYVALLAVVGPWGLALIAAHLGIMALATHKKARK